MYVRAIRQLVQHYHKPPDQISDEKLRQYFLRQKCQTMQRHPPSYSCAYGLHVLGRLQLNCFFDASGITLVMQGR